MDEAATNQPNPAGSPNASSGVLPGPAFPSTSALFSRFEAQVSRFDKLVVACSAVLATGGVAFVDYTLGSHYVFSLFYVVPISFASWFVGRRTGLFVALLSALFWFIVDYSLSGSMGLSPALWNVMNRLGIFLFTVFLVAHVRELHLGWEAALRKRTAELEVETNRRVAMEREIGMLSHLEQQRIAYELHDGLGQELAALAFQGKLLAARLAEARPDLARETELQVTQLNQAISRTRALSRLLDPVGAEGGTLRQSLQRLVDYSGRAYAISCTIESPEDLPALSHEAELHLYRITQEAIRNAVEHGKASAINVLLRTEAGVLVLTVADNGCGLSTPRTDTDPARGLGLRIMQYRAACLKAELTIRSEPGKGCQVGCAVPVQTTKSTS